MNKQPCCITIVDDEPAQRNLLKNALERSGYHTVTCSNGNEALNQASNCNLMLLDVRMPGMSGLEVLALLHKEHPELPVILLTAYIDIRDAVQAIKQGALDYLEKPVDLDELIAAIDDALGISGRNVSTQELILPEGVVAESETFIQLLQQAVKVAKDDATVLISGESGAGKEIVAETIHINSQRSEKKMVAVDCAALSDSLVESDLFGHEKGAFTGADTKRIGCFEEANETTLFLDEIGELPLDLQPKLLRVLSSGNFRRVGGQRDIRTNIRLIAATNRNLEQEVAKGRFREDLFFRLSVFPLVVPPLRERRDDILPLADHFLSGRHKKLSPAVQRLLLQYSWPGNIRELRNTMERAAILSSGSLILPDDLPHKLRKPATTEKDNTQQPSGSVLVGDMETIQKKAILEALEKSGGNKTRAAELLGISRRNFIYKLRAYGL